MAAVTRAHFREVVIREAGLPRDKASRTGHNPATGMEAPISPHRVVTFRPLLWPRDWENSGMAGTGRNVGLEYFRPPVRASICNEVQEFVKAGAKRDS